MFKDNGEECNFADKLRGVLATFGKMLEEERGVLRCGTGGGPASASDLLRLWPSATAASLEGCGVPAHSRFDCGVCRSI